MIAPLLISGYGLFFSLYFGIPIAVRASHSHLRLSLTHTPMCVVCVARPTPPHYVCILLTLPLSLPPTFSDLVALLPHSLLCRREWHRYGCRALGPLPPLLLWRLVLPHALCRQATHHHLAIHTAARCSICTTLVLFFLAVTHTSPLVTAHSPRSLTSC